MCKPCKRVYVCPDCFCWDYVVSKDLLSKVEEIRASCFAVLPRYWDELDTLAMRAGWTGDDFVSVEDVRYLELMKNYMEGHSESHREMRMELTDDAFGILMGCEA